MILHIVLTPGNIYIRQDRVRHQGCQVRWSTAHDLGLDDHRSNTQKSLKIAVKRLLVPNFSSPAAREKGLRLGDCVTKPRIGYPCRPHHPRHPGSGSWNPGRATYPVSRTSALPPSAVICPGTAPHKPPAPATAASLCSPSPWQWESQPGGMICCPIGCHPLSCAWA